jgi:hypothetical protein
VVAKWCDGRRDVWCSASAKCLFRNYSDSRQNLQPCSLRVKNLISIMRAINRSDDWIIQSLRKLKSLGCLALSESWLFFVCIITIASNIVLPEWTSGCCFYRALYCLVGSKIKFDVLRNKIHAHCVSTCCQCLCSDYGESELGGFKG